MEPSGKNERENILCRRRGRSLGHPNVRTRARGGTGPGETEAAQVGEEEGRKGDHKPEVQACGKPTQRPATRVLDHVLGGFASFLLNPCNHLNYSRGSPLHTNLQGANLQRPERASGSSEEPEPVPSTSGVSGIAARPPPLSLITDDPSVFPPGSNSSCLLTLASPCMPLYYGTFQVSVP